MKYSFQSRKVLKFQSFKVSKSQSFKVPKFQDSKIPRFQDSKVFGMISSSWLSRYGCPRNEATLCHLVPGPAGAAQGIPAQGYPAQGYPAQGLGTRLPAQSSGGRPRTSFIATNRFHGIDGSVAPCRGGVLSFLSTREM